MPLRDGDAPLAQLSTGIAPLLSVSSSSIARIRGANILPDVYDISLSADPLGVNQNPPGGRGILSADRDAGRQDHANGV